MGILSKVLEKIFKAELDEFYLSIIYTLIVASIGFSIFMAVDFLYGTHFIKSYGLESVHYHTVFGYLVHRFTWLQKVFQLCAFIGLGLAIDLFWQYHKTRKRHQEYKQYDTERIVELTKALQEQDRQLQIEKERYRKIIDQQVEFVTKFLPDGTITFVNRANYMFHGYDHWEQLVGKNLYELIDRSYAEDLKAKLNALTPIEPRFRHVQVMVGATGEIRYVDWINCGIFSNEGELLKVQGVGRDITRYVQEQREIEQREKYYRLLFAHMLSGFAVHRIVCDENNMVCDYAFIDINPAFEKLFGFTKDYVVGKTVLEVMPNTEPNIIARFGQVAETGEPDNFECRFVDINKWFHVTAFKPQPEHFAATYIDITDRKDRTGKRTRCTDPN